MTSDSSRPGGKPPEKGGAPRVAITTLGCKVNQYESAAYLAELENKGAAVVPFSESAEIYIINTCAVTARAAAQSRQCIRRALRINPKARVVVTGCYAQVASQEIISIADQPVLVGHADKHRLAELALPPEPDGRTTLPGPSAPAPQGNALPVRPFSDRTRAHIKVQDGCDNFCSYCIVPHARGRSRSLAPDRVVEQAVLLATEGYREFVLTGIHLGNYGQDLKPTGSLPALVRLLLRETPGVRLRLSSLEPTEITPELLDLLATSDLVMPHLHIPLQSGDNRILMRMNRRYRAEDFARIVRTCLDLLPDMAIGADVIAGFPGEDAEAFRATRALLEELPLAYLHVFPYSLRPGTVAATMPDQIPQAVKEERVALLRELDHKKRTRFYGRFLGRICRVLVENNRNGFRLLRGFSEQYVPVHLEGPATLENRVVDVRIERQVDRNVFGRLVAGCSGAGSRKNDKENKRS